MHGIATGWWFAALGLLLAVSAFFSIADSPSDRTAFRSAFAASLKPSLDATKSVSHVISTRAATEPSTTTSTAPCSAERPARFVAPARPFLRSQSRASSRSPPVSSSAFLHSIIPAPVRSRSCCDSLVSSACATPSLGRSAPVQIVIVRPDLAGFREQQFGFGAESALGGLKKVKRATNLLIDPEKSIRKEAAVKVERQDLKARAAREGFPSGAEESVGDYFRLLSGEK